MPIPETSQLNNALWRTRKSRGLVQKQVAWLLGHRSPNLISSYERGERMPNLVMALRLSVIYRTPVEQLFPEHCEAVSSELLTKASKIPGLLLTNLSRSEFVEDLSTCGYERLLEDPDLTEENSRMVRRHVTKLAKLLAHI